MNTIPPYSNLNSPRFGRKLAPNANFSPSPPADEQKEVISSVGGMMSMGFLGYAVDSLLYEYLQAGHILSALAGAFVGVAHYPKCKEAVGRVVDFADFLINKWDNR